MFNHYLRNLQTVQRWNIFPTIRTQHVAEHSYYVVLYVAQLMDRYFPDLDGQDKYEIMKAAVKHDAAEARMGDINGPTKRIIRDEAKYKQLESDVEHQLGFDGWDDIHNADLAKRLIKAADCLDEFFFLTTEVYLGNQMAKGTLGQVRQRLTDALQRLFGTLDYGESTHEVLREADFQMAQMLNFETLQNDTDVRPADPGDEIPF
jgi:5'-deoxynucleotidase YfbR-like HD superfamily hydrolase